MLQFIWKKLSTDSVGNFVYFSVYVRYVTDMYVKLLVAYFLLLAAVRNVV